MRPDGKPAPLYRKVNTLARNVHHWFGGDFRDARASGDHSPMRQGKRRGLDYTPLFRFLHANVGRPWNDVHSEACRRVADREMLFWIVALRRDEAKPFCRTGESSYVSGLFVDEDGILRLVDPELDEHSLAPFCSCCTHTMNGVPFTRPFVPRE